MGKALEVNDASAVIQADFDFHKRIITSVSNELFADYYDTLRAFLFKEIEESQGEYQDRSKILREHQELATAIRSGNIEQAATVYLAHIENIKNLLGRSGADAKSDDHTETTSGVDGADATSGGNIGNVSSTDGAYPQGGAPKASA
jgi:DNA-binding FadR family transcriptional regulator